MGQDREPHTGPPDFSELAHSLVERMAGEADDEPSEDSGRAAAGRKDGLARAAALGYTERLAVARQVTAARWARLSA